MSIFSGRLGFAVGLTVLCLAARTVHAQTVPVSYWIPGWPVGFGGILAVGPSSNTYGNVPSFDSSAARPDGFSYIGYNYPTGRFLGPEGSGVGLSMNGINQNAAFDNKSLFYEGVQFGYKFQNGGSPITLYAGFDTLKLNVGIPGPFAPFDSVRSTLPGYGAHAGFEFQPTSNVSLSLGVRLHQQSGQPDSDINSLSLPGVSPFGLGGQR